MEKFPAVEWAVISAVLEQQLDHARLKEFFFWLVSNLNTHTEKHGGLKFTLNPGKIIITARKGKGGAKREGTEEEIQTETDKTPDHSSSRNRTRSAYKTIRDDYPGVTVIFHVLPGPNSEEYEWMKIFATEFGFVRQGIQKENVLTNFQSTGADLDQIFTNMISWCEKSIEILALGGCHGPSSELVRSCTLAVTIGKEEGGGKRNHQDAFPDPVHPLDLQETVLWCLHGPPPVSPIPLHMVPEDGSGNGVGAHKPPELAYQKSRGFGLGSITSTETAHEFVHETDVLIQGLPDKLTQYEVACIFYEFRVKGLRLGLDARSAFVRLGSKFEAMQAVEKLDNSSIHEAFTVSVEPCNPDIQKEMKKQLAPPLIVAKQQRANRSKFQSGGSQ